jgi:hypothetical protein
VAKKHIPFAAEDIPAEALAQKKKQILRLSCFFLFLFGELLEQKKMAASKCCTLLGGNVDFSAFFAFLENCVYKFVAVRSPSVLKTFHYNA